MKAKKQKSLPCTCDANVESISECQRHGTKARTRVRVEHSIAGVKISRIAKDQFRNTVDGLSDRVMLIACCLHNLRVARRARRHRGSNAYFR